MSQKNTLIIFLLSLLCVWLVACEQVASSFECTDRIGCVTIGPDQPINLGILQALSGGAEPIGQEQSQTIELAISERNNQLLEHAIELQVEDSKCSIEGGANAALKAVANPQIVAILGPTCSGAATSAAKTMAEVGLVMVSGTTVAPSLTGIRGKKGADWQAGYFRTIYNGVDQGQAAAIFAFQQLGIRKAATINDGDAYTEGLTDVFEQVFTELGGEIVLTTAVNRGDTNMQPVLTAVANAKAEFLFFPLIQPEGDYIIKQMKEVADLANTADEKKLILMSASALLTDTLIESVEEDGVGIYFVGPAPLQNSANNELISKYKARYGAAPPATFYSYTYDATNLLLDAIEAVAIQEEDGTLHIGRHALREAMYQSTEFKGVTGTLSCNQFGDCGVAKFNIMRLDDPALGIEGVESNVIYTYITS